MTAQEARHHGVYSGFKAAKKTIAAETVASPVVVQTMTTGNDQNGRTGRAAPGRTSDNRPPSARPLSVDTDGPSRAEILGRVVRRLAEKIGEEPCRRYFSQMAELSIEPRELRVTVPSNFLAGQIERRYSGVLREVLRDVGRPAPQSFRLVVDRDAFEASRVVERATRRRIAPEKTTPPVRKPVRVEPVSGKYEFGNFIVGDENKLAYTAAMGVASGDTRLSPLFIHGECGLGKTHLLRAIASAFERSRPDARVRYVTAEAFTNEFIASMRANKLDSFRQRYRDCDLLCIDDVHFLNNKDKTQGEFLHTFDAIDLDGKLVAMASDEHPRDMNRVSAALTSRFMAGALFRLTPPGRELRLKVIAEIGRRRGLAIDPSAAEVISERAERATESGRTGPSVREIEGMVTRVQAACRLIPGAESGMIDAAFASRALGMAEGNSGGGGVRRPIRMQQIIDRVCSSLGVAHDEFVGRGRHKRVVLARALTVHLSRELTNHSYPEIARAMGRPNHSTVITAHKRIKGQIDGGEAVRFDNDLVAIDVAELNARLHRELERITGR